MGNTEKMLQSQRRTIQEYETELAALRKRLEDIQEQLEGKFPIGARSRAAYYHRLYAESQKRLGEAKSLLTNVSILAQVDISGVYLSTSDEWRTLIPDILTFLTPTVTEPTCPICGHLRYDVKCLHSEGQIEKWVEDHTPATEPSCNCKCSDAWRCAREKNLSNVIACSCECHRYITPGAAALEEKP